MIRLSVRPQIHENRAAAYRIRSDLQLSYRLTRSLRKSTEKKERVDLNLNFEQILTRQPFAEGENEKSK